MPASRHPRAVVPCLPLDAIVAECRALPGVSVTEPHVFDGPDSRDGREALAHRFGERSRLLVQH